MDSSLRNAGATATRFASAVVGGRVGLVLFLGTMLFVSLTWRIEFFITDNYTLANTLVGVADGHLYVDEIVYTRGSDATPGMHVVDNRLYGRNYGQLFLALPVLWILEAVVTVADPAVAIVGLWSLVLLAFCDQVGAETGRRDLFTAIGVVLAITTFAVNLALAHPIDSRWFPLMALQLSTMVAAGLTAVFSYRLLDSIHGRRTGVFTGVGVALVTPLGVWAAIPKRHTLTALLAVLAVYSFYRSRASESVGSAFRFRAIAYVWAGLTTWVHAPEGAVLLAALALVDIPTARANDFRRLAVLGAVVVTSLLPVFATNYLVASDPLTVPRLLPSYDGHETIIGLDTTVDSTSGDATAVSDQSSTGRRLLFLAFFWSLATTVHGLLEAFVSRMADGLDALSTPKVLLRVFLRRGTAEYWIGIRAPKNLSVLESMPIAALLVAMPSALYRRWDRSVVQNVPAHTPSVTPRRATDLLGVVYLSILVLIYAPSLPVHASITVRYLLPLYPLVVYFVARQDIVRSVLSEASSTLVWSYTGFVLIGGQLLVAVLVSNSVAPAEAIQLHGLVALTAAGLLVVWTPIATIREGYEQVGAVLVGLAGAVTTLFVLLSAHAYFGFMNRHAIPITRLVSEAITLS